jgi:Arc/MetJ-type ribon-helix-helix transcriptional regulator
MLKNVGIRLPVEILDAIDKKIKEEDRGKTFTRSDAIREAIDNWVGSCQTTSNSSEATVLQDELTILDIDSIQTDICDENGEEIPAHPLIQKVLDYLSNDGTFDQIGALSSMIFELNDVVGISHIDMDSESLNDVAERWDDFESKHGRYPSMAYRINRLEIFVDALMTNYHHEQKSKAARSDRKGGKGFG